MNVPPCTCEHGQLRFARWACVPSVRCAVKRCWATQRRRRAVLAVRHSSCGGCPGMQLLLPLGGPIDGVRACGRVPPLIVPAAPRPPPPQQHWRRRQQGGPRQEVLPAAQAQRLQGALLWARHARPRGCHARRQAGGWGCRVLLVGCSRRCCLLSRTPRLPGMRSRGRDSFLGCWPGCSQRRAPARTCLGPVLCLQLTKQVQLNGLMSGPLPCGCAAGPSLLCAVPAAPQSGAGTATRTTARRAPTASALCATPAASLPGPPGWPRCTRESSSRGSASWTGSSGSRSACWSRAWRRSTAGAAPAAQRSSAGRGSRGRRAGRSRTAGGAACLAGWLAGLAGLTS